MKVLRKLTVLCSVLCLLLTLWVPAAATSVAAAEQPEDFYFGRSILEQMPNSAALCYAYDRLVEGYQARSSKISVEHRSYVINQTEATTVYNLMMADHPEFFWTVNGISLSGYTDKILQILPKMNADTAALQAQIDARVAELTADLAGKSDYEKSLILHDRVCNIVTYNLEAPNDQSVVGSLLDGQAVCAGYARAYQLLMQAVGIPVFYVTGKSKGEDHAWNLVKLDGEWYYTDVTWDDQNDDGGPIYHAYLNNTFARIEEDHTAVGFLNYLPKSTATALNYHVKNGLQLSSFNVNSVVTILRKGNPAFIYITGETQTFINTLHNNLLTLATTLASNCTGYSANFSQMGREICLQLTVKHPHNYQTVTVNATCLSDGSIKEICRDCGTNTVTVLPATGHNYVHHAGKAPTCTENGWAAYDKCANCGDSTYTALPATGHNMVQYEGQDSTCTEGGWAIYDKCSTCGYSTYMPLPATGHNLIHHDSKMSTCTEDGWTAYDECTNCDYTTYMVISATGHNYVHHDGKAPTCTEDGWTAYDECANCGDTDYKALHATGHNLTHYNGQAPTCTEDGWAAYDKCTTCGYSTYETIPATGHDLNGPWYVEEDFHALPCIRCDSYAEYEGPHEFGSDHICTFCGYEEEVALLLGDVNNDGRVNNRDLGLLQQYLADWGNSINLDVCDVNNDGRVNNRDLGRLQQYLADWDVSLG